MGDRLLVMAAALLILLPQSRLNSSVLAMLPKQAMGDIPPALNDGFMQRLDRQLVWLVSPGKEANRGGSGVADAAAKSAALGDVKGPMDAASQQAWGAFFWQHRNGWLTPTPARACKTAAKRRRSGSSPSFILRSPG
ncbi:hypothetical protein ECZU34_26560 [Escherichia coli]|nr:hypothetical protein ECZU34_26560 [Escherichia coli]